MCSRLKLESTDNSGYLEHQEIANYATDSVKEDGIDMVTW